MTKHLSNVEIEAIRAIYKAANTSPEILKKVCQFFDITPERMKQIAKGKEDELAMAQKLVGYFNTYNNRLDRGSTLTIQDGLKQVMEG